jgi:hypothetical protein
MIEAVADAATGEFERLKEFGIKSRNQGDTIAFTFRGNTEIITNSAKDIEEWLIRLGETNFAGSMARQMDTIAGKASNLGDSWNKLFLTINEQGIGDLMTEGFNLAIGVVEELDAQISSGEFTGNIEAIADKFDGVGMDIAKTLDIVTGLVGTASHDWGVTGAEGANFISDAFTEMPENIRASVQLITVEIAALADTFSSMWSVLTGKSTETLEDIDRRVTETVSIQRDMILAERTAALEAFDAKIIGSNKLRDAYEEQAKSRSRTDLGQFGQGGEGQSKKAIAAAKKNSKEWLSVWLGTVDTFSSGMGDAFADAALSGENFTDSWSKLQDSLRQQILSSLIEIGIKQSIFWAAEKAAALDLFATKQTLSTASTALHATDAVTQVGIEQAKNTAITTSAAPAAVASTIATGGTNVPLALAALAGGIVAGKALFGQAHAGLTESKRDQTILISKGEAVIQPEQNKDLRAFLKKQGDNGGSRPGNVNININAIDTQTGMEFIQQNRAAIANAAARISQARGGK